MPAVIYLDGKFVGPDEATVSVYDHGFLYGDGVFEGIRVYGRRVFKLEEHLDRLYESAHSILLDIPLDRADLRAALLETCRRTGLDEAYIRLVVSRGRGDLGLDPRRCPRPTVVIIVDRISLFPPEVAEKGLRLVTAAVRRPGPEALNPRIKSLNYLNNILAKIEGNLAGVPEVLICNDQGYVVEGSGDNFFIVKGGRLLTPPPSAGILLGITRNTVMDLARELGIPVAEVLITRHDVYTADEAFLTGTAAELAPVVEADGRSIGDGRPGPVTRRLHEAFFGYARHNGTPLD